MTMTNDTPGQGPVHRVVRPDAEARWYCVSKGGRATLCTDEADAIAEVERDTEDWPLHAPYRAVQMVDVAESLALHRDAERYRWLRENTHGEADARGRQEFCMPDPHPQSNIMRGSVAQHLDAAIDAEIKMMAETKAAVG
jgi:hypothetical protein